MKTLYEYIPSIKQVLARCMSRLISSGIAESENCKMKNSCPKWDSNPTPPAYYTGGLTDFAMEPL